MRLEYDEDGTYLLRLRMAYQAASAAAVKVLHEHNILHGLESLKKYFLTAQGDLFLSFMDAGDIDLKSPNIPMQQLQDVLQLSVHACSIASDPVASSLQIVYGSKSLHQMMLDLTRNSKSNVQDFQRGSSSTVSSQVCGYITFTLHCCFVFVCVVAQVFFLLLARMVYSYHIISCS